jgi:hypothetical protein
MSARASKSKRWRSALTREARRPERAKVLAEVEEARRAEEQLRYEAEEAQRRQERIRRQEQSAMVCVCVRVSSPAPVPSLHYPPPPKWHNARRRVVRVRWWLVCVVSWPPHAQEREEMRRQQEENQRLRRETESSLEIGRLQCFSSAVGGNPRLDRGDKGPNSSFEPTTPTPHPHMVHSPSLALPVFVAASRASGGCP